MKYPQPSAVWPAPAGATSESPHPPSSDVGGNIKQWGSWIFTSPANKRRHCIELRIGMRMARMGREMT